MAKRNLIVGLFVSAGVILFAVGLFLIGNRKKAFDHHMVLYTEFADLGGVAKGAKVRVAGMEGGQVTGIDIPDSPSARFRVRMQVDTKLRGLIRTDSIASVATEGVVGDTYILIHTGSVHAQAAAAYATLPGKEPFDLAALLDKGNKLVGDAGKTINDADATIKQLGGSLQGTLGGVNVAVANANDVIAGIKQGRGAVGLLLRDEKFSAEVQHTLDNAQDASGSLAHASTRTDQLIADIQSRNLPQKVDDTLKSAQDAAGQLDATSKQLNQTIAEATAPDRSGLSAGENLRDSLSNADNATANLADDTEALKHEFFFQGFFKKRGYYQLSELSPATYRTNKVFVNPADHRLWLPTASLFDTQADGTEQLSARGKSALDEALAQGGGEFTNQALVVEGYSGGADASTRLAVSRRRSVLVSHYLQAHFQLEAAHVGYIGLDNAPPAGVGHDGWDGVCVVVLAPRHK
ncbi:MlaD family protein [Acidipila sp. EB88]|uniref:MlaD family protein n=1 Tax=Acidipila sp. EB88 TaxID=2305226 RepID=UPI000F5E3BAF|nr:MlaD family protein [Acidipila sp. EB88]RRA49553.1 MCE family protein [Acidipila sp. EB88]